MVLGDTNLTQNIKQRKKRKMLSVLNKSASEDGIKLRKMISKDDYAKNCAPILPVTEDHSSSDLVQAPRCSTSDTNC